MRVAFSVKIPPMGIRKLILVFGICLLPSMTEARPISYPGGSTVMLKRSGDAISQYYHYSPTFKYSVGLENVNDRLEQEAFRQIRATYLLTRKNTARSQRNLYLAVGISPDSVGNYFYGLHGDWETRRWYSGFGYLEKRGNRQIRSEKFLQFGVAPYLGEYGDFHTWIMVKAKHRESDGKWDTYPMLKFYQGDMLMELGYSQAHEWDIHIMIRF